MAHFAQLDENNVVLQVLVVANAEMLDENGNESEAKGASFLQSIFGGRWIQTSYNNKFRKQFAGVGFTYNAERDAFVRPQPYPEWVFNEDALEWEPPTPYPNDGKHYIWRRDLGDWFATGGELQNQGVNHGG
jgi:hypothetical protein